MILFQCTMTGCSGTVHCSPSGTPVCCGAGTYFAEGVSTSCQACPSGTYGSGNATACTACAAGTFSSPGASVCTVCPANTGSAAGAAGCVPVPGYYFGVTGTRFPSSGMTADNSVVGSETFIASASSEYGYELAYQTFNYVYQTSSSPPNYDWTTSSGPYTGTGTNGLKTYASTSFSTLVDGNLYYSEYLQLCVGTPRLLGQYSIRAGYFIGGRTPSMFVVAGSNDGVVWTTVDKQTTLTAWTTESTQTFNANISGVTFTYFRLIVLANGTTGDGYVTIEEWMLYTGALNTCSITGCTAPTPNGECSTSGSTICCATGTYWVPSSTTAGCTVCPLGTYASTSTTACTSCPAGFFSSVTGASVCTPCAAGTSSLAGSSSCPLSSGGTAAPVGQYWSGSGYVACPTNSFCAGGASAAQTCTVCAAGSYSAAACNASADTNCTACGSGKFSSAANASVCTSCSTCTPGQSVGTSCTASTNTICSPCASGTYGTTGVTCTACSAGLNSPAGSTACSVSYPVYALVTDYGGNTLRKVNLDGTAVSTLASTGLSGPQSVSISDYLQCSRFRFGSEPWN